VRHEEPSDEIEIALKVQVEERIDAEALDRLLELLGIDEIIEEAIAEAERRSVPNTPE
jgi:hypothetical protein